MQLRPYQQYGKNDIYQAWNSGHRNVLYVLPTGGGKTFTFSDIVGEFRGEAVIIAHRETLLTQISLSLAKLGVRHRILAPIKVIREISFAHVEEFKESFVDPLAIVTVGGVDTMVRRLKRPEYQLWAGKVKLWVQDECHHCLKMNKWGKVLESFPNAYGLGVTATPTRTDGNGLGSHADGVFDFMVEGPTMKDLIKQGYLVPYKVYCPLSDFDISTVEISKSGELSRKQLNKAIMESTIIADVVVQYKKYADGLKGLTFCPSVELADIVTERYIKAGIPAAIITADTKERRQTIQSLADGTIKQIVSVDVLGEGMDVPSVEVCTFLRRTESLGLYIQQFGRGMRPSPGKSHVIILDHVRNVLRHNFPDIEREWTLDRRPKKPGKVSLITCTECYEPYEFFHRTCPHCGAERESKGFSPREVDGDLTELTEESLSKLRSAIKKIDNPVPPWNGLPVGIRRSIVDKQDNRRFAQTKLRTTIAQWAGNMKYLGKTDPEIYRLFFQETGVDIMTAQTLGTRKATELMESLR